MSFWTFLTDAAIVLVGLGATYHIAMFLTALVERHD